MRREIGPNETDDTRRRMWISRIRSATLSSCIPTRRGGASPERRCPASSGAWWSATRPATPWTRPWPTGGWRTSRPTQTSPGSRRRQGNMQSVNHAAVNVIPQNAYDLQFAMTFDIVSHIILSQVGCQWLTSEMDQADVIEKTYF